MKSLAFVSCLLFASLCRTGAAAELAPIPPNWPTELTASKLTPAPGVTGVDVGTSVSLKLSDSLAEVQSCSNCRVSGLDFELLDPTHNPVPGMIQINGRFISFTPSVPLNLAAKYIVYFSLYNKYESVDPLIWKFTTETTAPNPALSLSGTNQTFEPQTIAFYQKLAPSDTSVVLWQVETLASGAGSYIMPAANYFVTFSAGAGPNCQSVTSILSSGVGDTLTVTRYPTSGALSVAHTTNPSLPGYWFFLDSTPFSMTSEISLNGNQIFRSFTQTSFTTLQIKGPPTGFFAALVPAGTRAGTTFSESLLTTEVPLGVGQSVIITGSSFTGYALSVH